MNKQELGVAVVGSGRIGTLRANMASRHPSVRFLAVSDKDAERAGLLAESVGADLASSDNDVVISHPDVNTVVVSTPEHDHVEPILQALELGKPVFVEKPLALTLEDADKIVEAVERSGVELRIGYSRRHDRRWMLAKEQIAQGRLGDILGIQSRVYNTRAQMMEIHKRSPAATPVLDALTYYVDMACWYLDGNRPVEVIARGNSKIFRAMGYSAQDLTWAIITFDNGALVNLGIFYALPAKYPTYGQSARFEVLGEEGVIILDMDNKDSFLFTDKGVPHAYVPDHNVNALFMQSNSSGDWAMGDYWGPIANETRSWLDHLAVGTPSSHTTAQEGRRTLEVTPSRYPTDENIRCQPRLNPRRSHEERSTRSNRSASPLKRSGHPETIVDYLAANLSFREGGKGFLRQALSAVSVCSAVKSLLLLPDSLGHRDRIHR